MKKLHSIQFLRAFACLSVLYSHVLQMMKIKPFGDYYLSGVYGVDLFFVLSGYLIYLTTKEGENWIVFLFKRFFRIYPLYWSVLLLFVCWNYYLKQELFTLEILFQNLTLLPVRIGAEFLDKLIVGVSWSTVYEIYFYIIFLIVLFLRLPKLMVISFLILILICLRLFGFLTSYQFESSELLSFFNVLAGRTLILSFVFGVLIAVFQEKKIRVELIHIPVYLKKVLFIIIQLLFLIVLLTEYTQWKSYVFTILLFLSWLNLETFWPLNFNNRLSKALLIIGDVSYSIYLLHTLIIAVAIHFIQSNNIYLIMVTSYFFSIMVSIGTYYGIELPFIYYAKEKVKKIRQ